MSGINTLLQTLIGTRLPTVMNASFAFVVPVLSIARGFDSNDFPTNHQVGGPNLLSLKTILSVIFIHAPCRVTGMLCGVMVLLRID